MCPCASAMSMAGKMSDQILAAIMTPAAKPIMLSSNLKLTCLVKKTKEAPNAVIPHVNNPAINACATGCSARNQSGSIIMVSL